MVVNFPTRRGPLTARVMSGTEVQGLWKNLQVITETVRSKIKQKLTNKRKEEREQCVLKGH